MGDSGGRRHMRGSGNPVGQGLHRGTTGNRGVVGGAMSLILDLCKGDRVLKRGEEEEGVVAPRGDEKNFGQLWKTQRKLKGGGGAVGRWACIRTATGRERKSRWIIGMLGQRRETPRWVNDLVWKSQMLGRIQGTPRWADEPVWYLRRVIESSRGDGVEYTTIRGRV